MNKHHPIARIYRTRGNTAMDRHAWREPLAAALMGVYPSVESILAAIAEDEQ